MGIRWHSRVMPMACSTDAVMEASKDRASSVKLAYRHMLLYRWKKWKITMHRAANGKIKV